MLCFDFELDFYGVYLEMRKFTLYHAEFSLMAFCAEVHEYYSRNVVSKQINTFKLSKTMSLYQ